MVGEISHPTDMGFYSKYILPRMIHFVCRAEVNARQREKVVPRAQGRVLEIGAGSGLNLPYYDATRVRHLFALEPAAEMWAIAEPEVRKTEFPVDFIQSSAETIPIDSDSIDTVLVTYTLCSIPEADKALREMHRVQWLSPSWSSGRGLGFSVWRREGRTLVGHGGWVAGHRASIAFDPNTRLGVVVLTNSDEGGPGAYVNEVLDLIVPALERAIETTRPSGVMRFPVYISITGSIRLTFLRKGPRRAQVSRVSRRLLPTWTRCPPGKTWRKPPSSYLSS